MNGQRNAPNAKPIVREFAGRSIGQQEDCRNDGLPSDCPPDWETNYDSLSVQWERVTAAVAAAAAGLRGEVPSNDQAEGSAGLGYPHPIVY